MGIASPSFSPSLTLDKSYLMPKVCVIGLGYIGLPTAALLASSGFFVHGVDINPHVIETINTGNIHIHEPDLQELVVSAISNETLQASLSPVPADVFILTVPTPLQQQRVPDISYIKAASEAIAPYLEPNNLIILESTSPVGTTEKLCHWLQTLRPDLDPDNTLYVAYCPERVLPGQILKELTANDRVVGGINPASTLKTAAFYKQFVNGEIHCTDARTAELSKLAENAFRDVNIAFANELSLICDHLQIDVWELIAAANHHPRVNILNPGPGVGGHCVAVDPWFVIDSAPEQAQLIRMARTVNEAKPQHVIQQVHQAAAHYDHPKIAVLGLTYKANSDDLRESPAVKIVQALAKQEVGEILVVEPHIQFLPDSLQGLPNLQLVALSPTLHQANIVLLLVDHRVFRTLDWQPQPQQTVIDTWGFWR